MQRWKGLFIVTALAVAGLLYILTPTPCPDPYSGACQAAASTAVRPRFIWVFSEVLIDEILALLAVFVLLVPLIERRMGLILKKKVKLSKRAKILSTLAVVVGLSLFTFWAAIDVLGGYAGPSRLLSGVYITYDGGVEAFSGFCIAGLGLILLWSKRGIGTAVRVWLIFAALIVMALEFAIWYFMPLDMWLHVTNLAYWSLGRYLSVSQFAYMVHTPSFIWCGNIYLLSNWNVLVLSSLVLLASVVKRARADEQ
jgi:hypothetical protein